jgi:hypothetical protein
MFCRDNSASRVDSASARPVTPHTSTGSAAAFAATRFGLAGLAADRASMSQLGAR